MIKSLLCIALCILCGAYSLNSRAEITNVNVSPTALTVDVSVGLTASVIWSVTLSESDAISREGEFFVANRDGALAPINNQVLSVTAPTNTSPQLVRAPETIIISAATAAQWWRLNIRELGYRRFFRDAEGSMESAVVSITLTNGDNSSPNPPGLPPPSQPDVPPAPIESPRNSLQGIEQLRNPSQSLRVDRLELRFTDQSSVAFVDQDQALHARLDISYQGFGLLRGYWQISDPVGPIGEPQFRNLSLVNKQLSASQRSQILSPVLPTQYEGRYYLRFCVTNIGALSLPDVGGRACVTELISTVVGYQVFPFELSIPKLTGVRVSTNPVDDNTVFSWPRVRHADLYQLKLLKLDDAEKFAISRDIDTKALQFVSGVLVSGSTTQTTLSKPILDQLSNQRYFVVVSAYGKGGELLSQSDPKLLFFRCCD
jgi:hypothetical protein